VALMLTIPDTSRHLTEKSVCGTNSKILMEYREKKKPLFLLRGKKPIMQYTNEEELSFVQSNDFPNHYEGKKGSKGPK